MRQNCSLIQSKERKSIKRQVNRKSKVLKDLVHLWHHRSESNPELYGSQGSNYEVNERLLGDITLAHQQMEINNGESRQTSVCTVSEESTIGSEPDYSSSDTGHSLGNPEASTLPNSKPVPNSYLQCSYTALLMEELKKRIRERRSIRARHYTKSVVHRLDRVVTNIGNVCKRHSLPVLQSDKICLSITISIFLHILKFSTYMIKAFFKVTVWFPLIWLGRVLFSIAAHLGGSAVTVCTLAARLHDSR